MAAHDTLTKSDLINAFEGFALTITTRLTVMERRYSVRLRETENRIYTELQARDLQLRADIVTELDAREKRITTNYRREIAAVESRIIQNFRDELDAKISASENRMEIKIVEAIADNNHVLLENISSVFEPLSRTVARHSRRLAKIEKANPLAHKP